MIKKILMRLGKKLYWDEGDLHSQFGVVKAEDIEKAESVVNTHSGKELFVYNANFLDNLAKIKRGPQTLVPKDLAYIAHYASLDKNSLVVDAGAGCGALTAVLARQAGRVVSYDLNEGHLNLAKKNAEFLGVTNVEFKLKDVYEGIDEKDIDVLTLDLPEPWRVPLDNVKNGGTVIVYLPTITQVAEFCNSCTAHIEKVIELIEREWFVEGKKVRPKSEMLGHTAFLIIVRKV